MKLCLDQVSVKSIVHLTGLEIYYIKQSSRLNMTVSFTLIVFQHYK